MRHDDTAQILYWGGDDEEPGKRDDDGYPLEDWDLLEDWDRIEIPVKEDE